MTARRATGAFGRGERKKRGGFSTVVRIFIFGAAILLIPFAYKGWHDLYVSFLEKSPPVISFVQPPTGVGEKGAQIRVRVTDAHSGIDEVIVRGEQLGEIRELKRVRVPAEHRLAFEFTFELPGAGEDLQEGDLLLLISAFDRSFWANGSRKNLALLVDYTRPSIQVVTRQHNAVLGGSELVFYTVSGKGEVFSGVKAGEWLFPGFPARDLAPVFDQFPTLHFAFFPVPLEFERDVDIITLFARDAVGNLSGTSINYRVLKRNYPERKVQLESELSREQITAIARDYLKRNPKKDIASMPDSLAEQFRLVNHDSRRYLEEQLSLLFQRPKRTKYWSGSFARQVGSSPKGRFGEFRKFFIGDELVAKDRNPGADLASIGRAVVRAGNGGIIIFAADLGLYGKTVIVDHGFGLTTLYAHMGKVLVEEGQEVLKGEALGEMGSTGLARGNFLHYETRVHGIPVRPEEWWDRDWVEDHIEQKIEFARRQMGLAVPVGN